MLLPKLGARVLLCGPKELLPEDALGLGSAGDTGRVEIERDFDEALRRAQVAMMLRIQRERLAGLELDLADYVARYQLNEERLTACSPSALVMHPGPMIRGLEISGEVADGPNSAIEDQVRHGLAVRTALLARALGVGGFESVTL
jgi:aspartate carbamoyltransferase catalytic subunit